MRTVLCALLAFTLAGCGLELLGATAIQSELRAESMQTMARALDQAKGTTSELEVQHAINAYCAEKGAYPQSLEELVPEWLPSIPTKPDGTPYGYDPETGQLLDRPMPVRRMPAGETDSEKMARISQAIYECGQETGYYPRTLQELVPYYLKEVPKTADGQDFIYDMRDGSLYHPNPAALEQPTPFAGTPSQQQVRQPTGAGGVGIGGPMGEVMTGIGIQQELNNMSSAGSSAAGSRMRQKARNTGQDRDNQVNQQMQDLGL